MTAVTPPGQAAALGDLGDDADVAVLAVVARDDEHALVVADVGGDRRGHSGKRIESSSGIR